MPPLARRLLHGLANQLLHTTLPTDLKVLACRLDSGAVLHFGVRA
jgi:hypothetical protein